MTVTSFRVLGPVQALVGDAPVDLGGNRERALLALLLLTPGKVVSTDVLTDELWEGDPPEHAAANLRVHVSRLRKALGGELLQTRAPGYVLQVDHLDLHDVEDRVRRSRARTANGDLDAAVTELREALTLWHGRPFADVSGPPAVTAQAVALEERRLVLLEELLDLELSCGRHGALIGELESLTSRHPLRERLWEVRMLALYRAGRQAEALAAYQAVRSLLIDEHGLEPNPGLRRLEQAILNQDASLDWTATPTIGVPLPSALQLPRSTPFVGRTGELASVRAAWAQAGQGHRRALLVAGEPGIGKSRLLAEAAQETHAAGGLVLFGRCDEETLVPYQPLVEALRHYAAHTAPTALRDLIGRDASELTRLLPDLRDTLGPADAEVSGGERYRLFETVNALLSGVSSQVLVLLVLEDLQWVDTASALLLQHLFRHPMQGALLVLGSYRDVEIAPGHPFADALGELRRPENGERVRLEGLLTDDVAAIIAATVGDAGDADFAASLQRQTEGNPFFVEEVARQLRDAQALRSGDVPWDVVGIPEGVRDVIGRRLQRLSDDARRLLDHAAVVGRTFETDVVEQVAGLSADQFLDAVEEAIDAGLLRESAHHPGRYAFTHDLVRQTLYSQLSLLRRVRVHRAVGEQLESVPGDRLAELAHHFLRSATGGDVDKAQLYATRAGSEALRRLAYEEGGEYFQRVLEVLEDDRDPRRAEPLLGLGESRRRAGDTNGSRAAFLSAALLGRVTADADLLGRAALGYGQGSGGLHRAVRCDEQHIALLEEALALLGSEDSPLRVRLLARLAEELYFTPFSTRRAALAEEAVQIASRLDEPGVLLAALYGRDLCRVGPDSPPVERVESTGLLVALALELGDRETAYLGYLLRELALIEAGDLTAGLVELEGAESLAEELRMPSLQAWAMGARARRAWMAGDLQSADEINAVATGRAMELGGDPDVASLVLGGQLLAHQLLRGDLSGFVAPLEEFRDAYPHLPILRGFLAYAYADTGDLVRAAAEIDDLGSGGFADIPRTVEWPGSVWSLSRTVHLLGDAARADLLYAEALPLSGQWFADWASICLGPVDTVLGLLSLVRRDVPTAVQHLRAAVAQAAAMPSPPWLADAQLHLATALRLSGSDQEAAPLEAAAVAVAMSLGLASLLPAAVRP